MNVWTTASAHACRWTNEPANWSYTEQGGLHVEAPANSDYYQDPAGKHIVSSAPFLHFTAGSSFELTTRLTVEMKHKYDSGCLMLMADDRNWAKLCFEFNGRYPTIVSVVTIDGVSDDCNSERVEVEKPYLRIVRQGNCITFFYSADGEVWEQIRYFGMKLPDECLAGVVSQSPQGTGCTVQYESLTIGQINQ
ncbi:hypothetical protein A8990_12930 [Paenibacillus taihuensis]|uniref:DUF1349 domain-containing protein n=1 Tax=Paenibacillus taihuensis TaxID=1156355 RepID=A0A3D9QWU0_9BACL|nr:DUF1349 domain-containing protein [Paenibacillus taihuensis]REE70545.1 hypothetical protein A8990_12930 [Paenibacillus taihuensis]